MILTDPTELYNNPNFGVGLKKHLWQYNNAAERAAIKDDITNQLRLHEPCVYPEQTKYSDGLLFSKGTDTITENNNNSVELTVVLQTVFKEEAHVVLNSDVDGQ
jgi:hypothetical protein